MEIVRGRNFEHSQVHRRILVAGEADVSNLPRLFRIRQGIERPAGSEEPVRILHPDVLVKLNQVDVIRLFHHRNTTPAFSLVTPTTATAIGGDAVGTL